MFYQIVSIYSVLLTLTKNLGKLVLFHHGHIVRKQQYNGQLISKSIYDQLISQCIKFQKQENAIMMSIFCSDQK